MTIEQRALIRYWVVSLSTLLALALLYFSLDDTAHFRWILWPAVIFAAVLERSLRPARPADAPTPLEMIQSSRAWSLFFVMYALSAVAIAIASVSFNDIGSWLSQNSWLLGPLVLAPVLIPLVQSEIKLYRVLGDESP